MKSARRSPPADVADLHVTVAICTWNRAKLLRTTLERMLSLDIPRNASWELIVVNNNCTDDTNGVLDDFRERLPLVRVFESKPGLSNARNAAIAAASGSFILWTDDDVLVAPRWLAAYVESMREHPDAAIMGGPIEPLFEGVPPKWLARGFHVVEGAYAARDLGREERVIAADALPFGANMVVRRDVQVRHLYDPKLGRAPGSMLGCEEFAVLTAILGQGGRGVWVPDARVRHFIPHDRQSLIYLLRYWRGNGISASRLSPGRGRFRFMGSPGWVWGEAISHTLGLLLGVLIHPANRWLVHMRAAAVSWGRIQGAWERRSAELPTPAVAAASQCDINAVSGSVP